MKQYLSVDFHIVRRGSYSLDILRLPIKSIETLTVSSAMVSLYDMIFHQLEEPKKRN